MIAAHGRLVGQGLSSGEAAIDCSPRGGCLSRAGGGAKIFRRRSAAAGFSQFRSNRGQSVFRDQRVCHGHRHPRPLRRHPGIVALSLEPHYPHLSDLLVLFFHHASHILVLSVLGRLWSLAGASADSWLDNFIVVSVMFAAVITYGWVGYWLVERPAIDFCIACARVG